MADDTIGRFGVILAVVQATLALATRQADVLGINLPDQRLANEEPPADYGPAFEMEDQEHIG